jgi:hypothetical protein
MLITEIIIHASTITKFKKDSIKYYPKEHIQAILGIQTGSKLYVYAFYDMDVIKRTNDKKEISIDYRCPEIEIEEDSIYKYFGNIHTHPNGPLKYSNCDVKEFLDRSANDTIDYEKYQYELLPGKIMGIMQINKIKNGYQYGLIFYNENLENIPLIISEAKEKK